MGVGEEGKEAGNVCGSVARIQMTNAVQREWMHWIGVRRNGH